MISRRFSIWLGLLLVLLGAKDALALPTITVQPVGISISSNLPAVFTVAAIQVGSLKPLSVQWRRNGQNIPSALTVSLLGIVSSTLTITNVQPDDLGSYSAVIYDSDGAVNSTTVKLILSNLTSVLAGDLFLLRGTLGSVSSGSVGANNTNATIEVGELDNAGKKGGASVWLKWVAPSNGVARFNTSGSDFDTTLGVYVRANARENYSITNLISIVGDDDFGGYFNSYVEFNTVANREYEIAVDGFYGSRGRIVLNWSLTPGSASSVQIPTITNQPQSLTVSSNASASFSINPITNARYQWYLNNVQLLNKTNATLVIPNVTVTNLGEYRALVYFMDPLRFTFSQPAHLQINSQGNSSSAAQAKFREATDPTSGPTGGPSPNARFHPNAVPVSGYTGSHIWNTYGAASEPDEPNHCGKAGGAPYWFSYKAPGNGSLTVDAYTPTFTNVLAVYTWNGGDFSGLNSVKCVSTNTGVGHQVAVFPATNGTTYYLVVDGLNGAVGNVTLSYNLTNPPAPPSPPVISVQPQSQTVAPGSNVTLTLTATGNPTPSYQWRTNTVIFRNQTNASLTVTNFQSAKEGNYDVVVTNTAGSVTSSVASLYLNSPARFGSLSLNATGGFNATLLGMANTNYLIQASTNLASANWLTLATNKSPFGIISITDTNIKNFPGRYYRAVPQ